MVNLTDSVLAPRRVPPLVARERFLKGTSALTFGVVRAGAGRFTLGPLTLITFGEPESTDDTVRWPVTGGLLTGRPGGHVGFRWRGGELEGFLEGWRPALPTWLYNLTQLPVHKAVTRLFLLQLRGRDPLPGPEAGLATRLAASAVDAALALAVARLTGGRRTPRRALALAAVYLPASWAFAGRTPGGALFGLRVVSVDGSRVTPAQAVLRLLLTPVAAVTGSDVHDARAGTAVVRR